MNNMFEPRRIEVRLVGGYRLVEKAPPVVAVDCVFEDDPGIKKRLDDLGYRKVSTNYYCSHPTYAYGWRYYALRSMTLARDKFWNAARVAYKLKLWHPKCRPGERMRWRNVRFGPEWKTTKENK